MHEKLAGTAGKPPTSAGEQSDGDMTIYRTLFQFLTPYVEKLIQEFYQITGYIRSEIATVRFEEIVIYGWASAVNYLDQYIENRLDIPTQIINPMAKLIWPVYATDLEDNAGAPFAPALGLALRKVSWL
jgi:Tfp pilus assembly PilM family ATPase